MFDLVGKAKHKAWSTLKSMEKEEAMKEYTKIVSSLFGGKIPTDSPAASVTNSTTQAPGSVAGQPLTLASVVFPRQTTQNTSAQLATVNVDVNATGIATVQLNRPQQLNALSFQMWQDLKEAFAIVESNNAARVAIITGTPRAFSAGMDLKVFADMQKTFSGETCEGRQREAIIRAIKWLQDAISSPEECPIPVLAAISGHCIGAGVDLICACDLRYCTNDATFCIKETDLAMVADVGTLQRLPKLIGDQRSRELTYTARVFTGLEAEQMGLVAKSFATYDEMMSHVTSVAQTIASKSPLTIRGVKKTILFTRDHSVEESLKQVQYHNAAHLYSSDLMEAMRATMAKDTPKYKD